MQCLVQAAALELVGYLKGSIRVPEKGLGFRVSEN